jgi:hypothetical protein
MFNHTYIKRSLVAVVMSAGVAFPAAAQAMHIEDSGGVPSAAPVQVAGPEPAAAVASAPSTQSSSSSFQWGDAGIGAAGAVVLLGTGAMGATLTRRRRRPALN